MQRPTLNSSRNLAARMGRWSASHRKTAIFGWLAFVIAAIAIGTGAGQKTIDQQNQNVGQAHRADQILKQAGFSQSGPLNEIVVVQSKTLTVGSPAFQAVVGDVVRTVAAFSTVHNLSSPSAHANRDQVSRDRHTALVEWDMSGPVKAAETRIDPLTSAVASVAKSHPDFYVGEAGSVSSDKALTNLFNQQLGQAGMRSIPLTLLILVLVFGSLLAAWIPLMLALMSVIATVGITDIISHITPMDPNVQAVVLLVGLAVGVDYTLFYLRREREERAAGRGERAALEAAAATSGRSVLISGATVMIAMAGMLFSGDQTFISFSIGHDDRRRRRDARLAHRAPSATVKARRPRREGPDPAARPPAAPAWRGTDLVQRPDPRPASSGHLGECRGGSTGRDGDPHAAAAHSAVRCAIAPA